MGGASKQVVIEVPQTLLYQVICDFAAYPDFLPEITGAHIVDQTELQSTVDFEACIIKDVRYTLQFTHTPNQALEWELLQGDMMSSNDGSWHLEALDESITEATYTIDVGLGLLVPKMVSRTLIETTLPQTLKHFKDRAEALYRDES